MKENEFGIFAKALKTFYPKGNILPTNDATELWYSMLKDIDYPVASAWLKKWVSTEKWPPSIADVREGCRTITTDPLPDWGAGWSEVIKAISRYGYYRESQALESMSPITRKTVERLGWKNLCLSENEAADRANFRNIYDILVKRENEEQQLPQNVAALIAAIKPAPRRVELPKSGTSKEFLQQPGRDDIMIQKSAPGVMKTLPGLNPLPKAQADESYKYVSETEANRMREDALTRLSMAGKHV